MTENNFQIDSAAVSDRGLSEKRPQNEDSFLEIPARGLFAVADGVGGAQAGDVASQMAVEMLGEAFANLRENGDAEELMKLAIERANESIFQMSHDLPQLATMATTMVALQISGNIATIGHVGDSRLYRLDTKGNLHRETQDHSVVEEEVRAGRMTATQAATHPSRNVISRALGADSTVEVDMKTIMFEPNTTFLLCSDGITRHIDDFQLRELLISGDAPAGITRRMKEICYERGAEDNLTAVIARVADSSSAAGQTAPLKSSLPTAALEEPTVASARKGTDLIVEQPVPRAEEIPTGKLEQIPRVATTIIEPEKTEESFIEPKSVSEPVAVITPVETPPVETAEIAAPSVTAKVIKEEVETYPVQESGSSGFLSKALSALLLLIVGGIVGAGLHYLFLQNNKPLPAPVITEMQTPNIEYTAFEDSRRSVDKNPQQFISASGAGVPDDAEGLYLLGRAFLLDGKFTEAKQMFLQARDRLAQVKEVNGKVLANEIAMGLAIINDPLAQKEFQNGLNPVNQNANLQTNQTIPQFGNTTTGNFQTP